MHVLILGAAGMIGRKLTERLVADASLGRRPIERLTLVDIVTPQVPARSLFPVAAEACDFAVPGAAERMLAGKPDIIFHLAAIVSGEAEADFSKGLRINLDGTRHLFDAIHGEMAGRPPRVVFTSS